MITLLMVGNVFSQKDTLYELRLNSVQNDFYHTNKDQTNSPYSKKRSINKAALTLPFVDDFSQHYLYPNLNLWQDVDVFINSNFPINPTLN